MKKTPFKDRLFSILASGRLCLILGGLYLVNQLLIAWIVHPVGLDALNLQLALNGEAFSRIVQGWSPDQLAAYYRHFYPDFIHPFLYAGFLASAVAFLTKQEGTSTVSMHRFLFYLPFAAGACDLLENVLHLYLVFNAPNIPEALTALSGGASHIKWFIVCMCAGGIGYLGFRRILCRIAMGKQT